jgi:hypothetical protein
MPRDATAAVRVEPVFLEKKAEAVPPSKELVAAVHGPAVDARLAHRLSAVESVPAVAARSRLARDRFPAAGRVSLSVPYRGEVHLRR